MITLQKLRDSQIIQTTCSNTRKKPKLGSFFAFGFNFSYTSASVEIRLKIVILCEDGRDTQFENLLRWATLIFESPLNRGFWSEALKT